MSTKIKNNKYLLLWVTIFLLLVTFFSLSPISGDDWGNYTLASEGIRRILGVSLGMYFDWEGRLVSRIILLFLTYHKVIWNIVNALLITGGLYLSVKYLKPKNKLLTTILVLGSFFLMNPYIFKEVVVWIAGNVTYLFPYFGIIIYLMLLKNDNKYVKYLLLGLNLILPMFVEHMAFILVLLNLVILGYDYYKNKKINYFYLSYFLISLLGAFLMYISPGSAKRKLVENVEFNNLNIFAKLIYNIPNLIFYTFINNSYLLILMLVATLLLINKQKYQNITKYILSGTIITFTTVTIIASVILKNLWIVNPNNILTIIIWLGYFTYFIFLLIKDKPNFDVVVLLVLGIFSNLIMMIAPLWGQRTTLATVLFLSLVFVKIIDQNITKYQKSVTIINSGLVILALVFYGILYFNTNLAIKDRKKIIEEQKNESVIKINYIVGIANTNINPDNQYHLKVFKKYYGIDNDKEIEIIMGNWKSLVFYAPNK